MTEPTTETKPILITGASRGLGAALAEALAAHAPILAVARTVGALEEVDDRIRASGGTATLAPLDVTDDGAMQHLCRSTFERWGGLSGWAHCAIHAPPRAPAAMMGPGDWRRSVAVNVEATQRLVGYVAPLLGPEAWAAFFDDPVVGGAHYGAFGASKAAQIALARSWQAETVRTGPRVHVLTPPPMPTATRARFAPGEDRAGLAAPSDVARDLVARILG
ncbi:MAG: SDR family NAD(P)-dependent oxidoreductase [Shimia sp.]